LSAPTITGGNLSLSGNLTIAGTLTTVNITSTNVLQTNVSAGTIASTNATVTNIVGTNISSGTARITTSLISLGNSNTIGNIYTTGGNVGVGTVSPGSSLHVAGSIPVSPVGGGVHLGIDPSTYTAIQLNSTAGNYIDFGTSGGDYQSRIFAGNTGNLSILTNGASNNGYIGINTISPSYTLDVTGTSRISSALTIGTGYTGVFTHQSISSNTNFPMAFCANAGNLASFLFGNATLSTNYVSINNVATGYTLDVNGTGRFAGKLTITGSNGSTGFDTAINDQYADMRVIRNSSCSLDKDMYLQLGAGETSTLHMYSNNSETMTLKGGNVGISTTAPSGMLHLNNAALFTSTGNLTCTGDVVSFGSLSDRRLKKNIETIQTEKALDIVSKLRAVTFDWKDDIFNEQKRNTSDLGFIAQEVEALVPEAVSEYTQIESGEVYKNIKHERIIPYLLSAIQYLLNKSF
jgi:hypothetical protein